jgi:hypothetical protein
MDSNAPITGNCPVCTFETKAKRQKHAIKSHIDRTVKSEIEDASLSHRPHHQYQQDHAMSDRDKHREQVSKNSRRVEKWRSLHPKEYKENNARYQGERMARKRGREQQIEYLDKLAPVAPKQLSDHHLMGNLYYLLSLLDVIIQPAAFMEEEVRDSLRRTESLLNQTGSEVFSIILYTYQC